MPLGIIPLLQVDMWEHAYYLQYKNVKADYVKAFWYVVNWADVQARFAADTSKTQGLPNLGPQLIASQGLCQISGAVQFAC